MEGIIFFGKNDHSRLAEFNPRLIASLKNRELGQIKEIDVRREDLKPSESGAPT